MRCRLDIEPTLDQQHHRWDQTLIAPQPSRRPAKFLIQTTGACVSNPSTSLGSLESRFEWPLPVTSFLTPSWNFPPAYPENMRLWTNVGVMLFHRLRRWTNIGSRSRVCWLVCIAEISRLGMSSSKGGGVVFSKYPQYALSVRCRMGVLVYLV